MSVFEKNYCPCCGSEATREIHLRNPLPKDIRDRLMAWTEFKCHSCGTKYIDGKLVIVKVVGVVEEKQA